MKKHLLVSIALIVMTSLVLTSCGSSQKKRTVRHEDETEEKIVDTTTESKNGFLDLTPATETSEVVMTETSAEPEEELIRLGIVNCDPNESGFRTANDADMKKMFTEDNGYDAVFYYTLKNDEMLQAATHYVESEEIDYLILNAADASGWEDLMQSAKDKGIKVILFDRSIDVSEDYYEAFIVSDMEKEGQLAVEWLESQDLSEYNILHIQGVMGSSAQIGRGMPLDNKADSDSDWNITLESTADWDYESAKSIVAQAIEDGVEFNVIYCDSDYMTKGAVAALDEAGISHGIDGDVLIVSFDGSEFALEELLNGNWNCVVQCSPYMASYMDDIIRNGAIPKTVIVDDMVFDAATITKEDVDNYGF